MPLRLFAAVVSGSGHKTIGPETSMLNGMDVARARVDWLAEAVRSAHSMIRKRPDVDATSQAVFLAPEYFFARTYNKDGMFFAPESKRFIVVRLAALSAECKGLLIVPGTVRSSRKLFQGDEAKDRGRAERVVDSIKLSGVHQVYNDIPRYGATTKAIDGGVFLRAQGSYLNPKQTAEKVSLNPDAPLARETEVARNTAYICLDGQVVKYHKIAGHNELDQESGSMVWQPGYLKGCFTVAGIRYALEVCADHAADVLESAGVDVHLVVSDQTANKAIKGLVRLHASTEPTIEAVQVKGVAKAIAPVDEDKAHALKLYKVDLDDLNPAGAPVLKSELKVPSSLGSGRMDES